MFVAVADGNVEAARHHAELVRLVSLPLREAEQADPCRGAFDQVPTKRLYSIAGTDPGTAAHRGAPGRQKGEISHVQGSALVEAAGVCCPRSRCSLRSGVWRRPPPSRAPRRRRSAPTATPSDRLPLRGQPTRWRELATRHRDGGRRDQRGRRHPRLSDRHRVPGHPSRPRRVQAGRRRHGRGRPVRLLGHRVLLEHDRQHGRGAACRDPDVRRRRSSGCHRPGAERRQRLHLPHVVRRRHGGRQVHQLHRRPGHHVGRLHLQERRVRRRRSRGVRRGVRRGRHRDPTRHPSATGSDGPLG